MKSDIWSPLGHGRFLIIFSDQDLCQILALRVPFVNRFLVQILDQILDQIRDQIRASRGPFAAQLSDTDSCKNATNSGPELDPDVGFTGSICGPVFWYGFRTRNLGRRDHGAGARVCRMNRFPYTIRKRAKKFGRFPYREVEPLSVPGNWVISAPSGRRI